jgi:hypothetical protein
MLTCRWCAHKGDEDEEINPQYPGASFGECVDEDGCTARQLAPARIAREANRQADEQADASG